MRKKYNDVNPNSLRYASNVGDSFAQDTILVFFDSAKGKEITQSLLETRRPELIKYLCRIENGIALLREVWRFWIDNGKYPAPREGDNIVIKNGKVYVGYNLHGRMGSIERLPNMILYLCRLRDTILRKKGPLTVEEKNKIKISVRTTRW